MYDIRQKEEGVQSWKEHTGTFINPVVFRIAWLLLGWFARLRQVQFPWGRADLQNQLLCTILRRKYNTQKNYSFYYVLDTWVISQACMRSRWLDIGLVLFFCVFMDRVGVEVHKREWRQYPAILIEQAWSVKNLSLYDFRGIFSCGTRRVVPNGHDSSISLARVANHSAEFDSSCMLMELAII